jgi:hypothetical protein
MSNYEKKYKEALNTAKDCLKDGTITNTAISYIETIFPELKESEDERIRKDIVEAVELHKDFTQGRKERIYAWLEKQCEQKFAEGTFVNMDDVREDFVQEVYRVLDADSTNDRANQIIDAFDNLPTVTIENQGEQKQDPCEHCKDVMLNCHNFPCVKKRAFEQGKSALEVIKEDGEKITYSETDGYKLVEPKFHEGEWIVHHGTENIYQVVAVIDNQYQLKYGDNYTVQNCADVDRCARLYDVTKDVKAGDVLFYRGNVKYSDGIKFDRILLFENLDTSFFALTKYSNGVEDYGINEYIDYPDNIIPATKEQRDLLFQKMKEKGYVYDAEKKQLRKMGYNKSKFEILKDTWYVCTCTTCTKDSRIWFNNGTAYLGSEILKYDLGFEPEEYQNYFRLWSIKDAKDGDVLQLGKVTAIFQNYISNKECRCYCSVFDGEFEIPVQYADTYGCHNAIPANKEQRDTLMKAMADAGYIFDFDKKELKKIENEIEIPYGAKDSELQEDTYYIPKGFHAEIDDDKVVIKKGEKPTEWSEKHIADVFEKVGLAKIVREQSNDALTIALQDAMIELSKVTLQPKPTAWSEEDEYCRHQLIVFCENCMVQDAGAKRCTHWLKSIRPRNTWKPSDAQMIALNDIIINGNLSNANERILKGLQEQLKKL